MVQNIPGKTFPTVWKQNFSLKTQMVQNIPGKSFPQQFENRIFCWKLIWYKTFQGKVSPNSLKTEFFVENSNGTKHSRKSFRKRLKSPQVYSSLSNFDLLNDPKMPKPALEACLLRVSYRLLLHAALEKPKDFPWNTQMLLFSRPLFSPKGKCLKWRAWENSPHFPRSPLVSPRSDVCPGEMSAYWWRVTTQISVVLLIGWKLYGISSLVPQWDVVSRGNCRCHRQMSAVSSGCYWVTRLLLRWMLFFFFVCPLSVMVLIFRCL